MDRVPDPSWKLDDSVADESAMERYDYSDFLVEEEP